MPQDRGWTRPSARGRWVCVLLALLAVSIGLYVLGWAMNDAWQDKWMPNFIATWVGALAVVLILDTFQAQEARRRQEPGRRLAGAALGRSLEGIVAFTLHFGAGGDIGELAAFTSFRPLMQPFWMNVDAQSFRYGTRSWRATLRETKTRLFVFLDDYKSDLTGQERSTIESLARHVAAADETVPWSFAERVGLDSDDARVRARLMLSYRATFDLFYPVAEIYAALSGDSLLSRRDFARFFMLALDSS